MAMTSRSSLTPQALGHLRALVEAVVQVPLDAEVEEKLPIEWREALDEIDGVLLVQLDEAVK